MRGRFIVGNTTQHYVPQCSQVQHSTALHSTVQNSTQDRLLWGAGPHRRARWCTRWRSSSSRTTPRGSSYSGCCFWRSLSTCRFHKGSPPCSPDRNKTCLQIQYKQKELTHGGYKKSVCVVGEEKVRDFHFNIEDIENAVRVHVHACWARVCSGVTGARDIEARRGDDTRRVPRAGCVEAGRARGAGRCTVHRIGAGLQIKDGFLKILLHHSYFESIGVGSVIFLT